MSEEKLVQELREGLQKVSALYNRLILLVGTTGSGKTRALRRLAEFESYPMLNLGRDLSSLLLDLTERPRILQLPHLLDELVSRAGGPVIALDNTEILFSVELRQDPLRLLQGLSRNRTIVASWFGTINGQHLTHAVPNHPEFRRYPIQDLLLVPAENRGPESNCWDQES
jgi:hypothetical protein